ncbi:MAG: DUF4252 domain-containing protein [Flavobacteriaceae bacterium]|jgi:hypothetical protein|nr:DUF4252 domain-containing protein [Flavobacteriaceae bacterium]
MIKRFKPIIFLGSLILFINCNTTTSLQKYFVQKSEDPAFLIMNVPIALDSIFSNDIAENEREALQGIRKLNLLFYKRKAQASDQWSAEVNEIRTVLKQPSYQHLMDFKGFEKAKFSLMYEGEIEKVKEGIVFFEMEQFGFGVLRILGSSIEPSTLLSMLHKVDLKRLETQSKIQLGDLGKLFKEFQNQPQPQQKEVL